MKDEVFLAIFKIMRELLNMDIELLYFDAILQSEKRVIDFFLLRIGRHAFLGFRPGKPGCTGLQRSHDLCGFVLPE